MKILVMSPDFPPGRGGIQRLAGELVAALEDDDNTVVSLASDVDDGAQTNTRVWRVPLGPSVDQRVRVLAYNTVALLAALITRPETLIVTHIVASPAARIWSRLSRRGHVLILHGQELGHRPGLMRTAVKASTKSVAVSSYTRSEAIRLGADPERIVVVNPGVDTSSISKASAFRRARYNSQRSGTTTQPTIVTVARLVDRYKGHDVMLEALAITRERVPEVRWEVVGDGPLRPELEQRTVEMELDDLVTFHGAVGDLERDRLMLEADVFAMPSRTTPEGGGEGFGLVFLEAAAEGLPVVAGAQGGALDAVDHGKTGLLVDPGDPTAVAEALIELLTDPTKLRTMSMAAMSSAASRTWESFADAVRDLARADAPSTRATMMILAVSHTGQYGGAERSLLTQLIADRDAGEIVPVLAAPPGELVDRARGAGVEVVELAGFDAKFSAPIKQLPVLAVRALEDARTIASSARERRAIAVHANSPRAGLIAVAARAFGAPAVVTHVRDCMPKSPRGDAVRRLLTVGSSEIVANSMHTATDFACGSTASPPRVVYNPLDERFFVGADRAGEAQPVRSTRELVMVGQISPWKRQDVAIRVLARLLERFDDLKLTIAGSVKFDSGSHDNAAYRAELDTLATKLAVSDRVKFLGEIEDVAELFGRASVVLVPSEEEPFGRVVIEAMASGAAVVATSIGGPREFIVHGENGMLADPSDLDQWISITGGLLADEALRRTIGTRARVDARQRFSIGADETRMSPVYRSVARVNRPRAEVATR